MAFPVSLSYTSSTVMTTTVRVLLYIRSVGVGISLSSDVNTEAKKELRASAFPTSEEISTPVPPSFTVLNYFFPAIFCIALVKTYMALVLQKRPKK